MAELKTQKNDGSVSEFLDSVADEKKRQDCYEILEIMEEATAAEAKMWGSSIVGFGSYHYKYASGREGDSFLTGFAPRKKSLTLYIMSGFTEYDMLLGELGKYSTGKSCLYIKSLDDVNRKTLSELVQQSARHMAESNA